MRFLRTNLHSYYRYGFQGQEKDDEVKSGSGNSINFKYRMYDPRLGKFLSVDPLTPEYPHLSPYHFSHNMPIWTKEIEGLEGAIASYTGGWQGTAMQNVSGATEDAAQSFSEWASQPIGEGSYWNARYVESQLGWREGSIKTNGDLLWGNLENLARGATEGMNGRSLTKGGPTLMPKATVKQQPKPKITTPNSGSVATQASLKTPAGKTIINSKHRGGLNPTAQSKGFDVPVKQNGYPDFSSHLYNGKGKNTVTITMTGKYSGDFDAANAEAGFTSTPKGYTWHHTETVTKKDGSYQNVMQLVKTDAHQSARHSGGVSIYKEQSGDKDSYN